MHGDLTGNTGTTNLAFGKRAHNDAIRQLLGQPYDWDFLEEEATDVTVAAQAAYQLPYNVDKVRSVTITVGTTVWPLMEANSRLEWNLLKESPYTSDIPSKFFVTNGNLEIYPTPASSSNVITIEYKKGIRDLSVVDYTTGTITATNGSAAIVGSGTTFTAAMVGRYIKVNADNYWYEIAGFTDTTHVTLRKKFQGTTAAAAAFTIGEMPVLPEVYHDLPAYKGAAEYWMKEGELQRANAYQDKFEKGMARLAADHGNKTTQVGIEDTILVRNPNLYITL